MFGRKTIAMCMVLAVLLTPLTFLPNVDNQKAYAQSDPDIFQFFPDTCTANEDIKGVEVTTNYFVVLCGDTSIDVKFMLRSNGNTTAGSGTALTWSANPASIWVQAMGALDCVVYYADQATDTLRKTCFNGSTVTTSTYTPSCTPIANNYRNKPLTAGGGEVYWPIICSTGGTVEIVRSTTMTLLTTLTGLTSGLPTCTTPRTMSLITATQATLTCDTTDFMAITYNLFSGGAISKGATSQTLIQSNAGQMMRTTIVSGGAITYLATSGLPSAKLEFVKWSVDELTYGDIIDNQLFGSGTNVHSHMSGQATDTTGNTVGAICAPDATNDSLTCFETSNNSPEPPNNQILNFPLGANVFDNAPIGSTGGDTYIIGQGENSSGNPPYYFVATGLVTPLPPSGTDGDDIPDNPNLPENDIPEQGNLWGCRLGFIPKEFCIPDPTDPDCNPDPTNIGCQWIPDENHNDIKTNGMGLLMNFLLMGALMGVVIGASHGKRLLQTANVALYAVVIIGSLGIGMLFQWHDGILFWVGVFAIVALGGIAIATKIGLINLTGGDSED